MEMFYGALLGIFATVVMDTFALGVLRKWINLEGLQIVPALLGRWVLSIPENGKLAYADVRALPKKNEEVRVGMLLHYLIGLLLGVAYLLVLRFEPAGNFFNRILTGTAYGFITNVFPWLVMYPAMGFGFFGWNLPVRRRLILFSLLNHLMYGLALGAGAAFWYL